MSEKATARVLMAAIPEQCPQRIESTGTAPGIADIWCGDCAIETKCLKVFPKRPTTPVVLDHPLTIVQYRWLMNRWRNGFKAFVVLQAERKEWFVFCAPDAFVLVNGNEVSRHLLMRQASIWSKNGIPVKDNPLDWLGLNINSFIKLPIIEIDRLRHEAGLVARWKDI